MLYRFSPLSIKRSMRISFRRNRQAFSFGIGVGIILALACALILLTATNIMKKNSSANEPVNSGDYFVPIEGEDGNSIFVPWTPKDGEIGYPELQREVSENGSMVVKQKKYNYKGTDVMILDITNLTTTDYNLTIKVEYANGDGKMVKREQRVFEGFPSGYQAYFVFNPGIKFYGFDYQLAGDHYEDRAYAAYFEAGSKLEFDVHWGHVDGQGRYKIPIGEWQVNNFPRVVCYYPSITDNVVHLCEKQLSITGDVVLFDENGELVYIRQNVLKVGAATEKSQRYDYYMISSMPPFTTDIVVNVTPETNKDFFYPLPKEYRSYTGLFAVKEVIPSDGFETKFPNNRDDLWTPYNEDTDTTAK